MLYASYNTLRSVINKKNTRAKTQTTPLAAQCNLCVACVLCALRPFSSFINLPTLQYVRLLMMREITLKGCDLVTIKPASLTTGWQFWTVSKSRLFSCLGKFVDAIVQHVIFVAFFSNPPQIIEMILFEKTAFCHFVMVDLFFKASAQVFCAFSAEVPVKNRRENQNNAFFLTQWVFHFHFKLRTRWKSKNSLVSLSKIT